MAQSQQVGARWFVFVIVVYNLPEIWSFDRGIWQSKIFSLFLGGWNPNTLETTQECFSQEAFKNKASHHQYQGSWCFGTGNSLQNTIRFPGIHLLKFQGSFHPAVVPLKLYPSFQKPGPRLKPNFETPQNPNCAEWKIQTPPDRVGLMISIPSPDQEYRGNPFLRTYLDP